MIPTCKDFVVTVLDLKGKKIASIDICTPTKMLARLIFRQDYIEFWGFPIKIGVKKGRTVRYG